MKAYSEEMMFFDPNQDLGSTAEMDIKPVPVSQSSYNSHDMKAPAVTSNSSRDGMNVGTLPTTAASSSAQVGAAGGNAVASGSGSAGGAEGSSNPAEGNKKRRHNVGKACENCRRR